MPVAAFVTGDLMASKEKARKSGPKRKRIVTGGEVRSVDDECLTLEDARKVMHRRANGHIGTCINGHRKCSDKARGVCRASLLKAFKTLPATPPEPQDLADVDVGLIQALEWSSDHKVVDIFVETFKPPNDDEFERLDKFGVSMGEGWRATKIYTARVTIAEVRELRRLACVSLLTLSGRLKLF